MKRRTNLCLRLLFLIVLPQLLHATLKLPITLQISAAAGLVWIVTATVSTILRTRQNRRPVTAPSITAQSLPTQKAKPPVTPPAKPAQPKAVAEKLRIEVDQEADLAPNEYLNRIDAKTWYFNRNETVLAQIIDDLNVRGCRQLSISADGTVHITEGGHEQTVSRLNDFPHHMNWPELCQLLAEDDINATITKSGIQLSWIGG